MPSTPTLDDRTVEALFAGRSIQASGDDLIDLEAFVDALRFEMLEHPQPSAALAAVLRDGVEAADPVAVAMRRRDRELQLISAGSHPMVAELRWIMLSWQRAAVAWLRIVELHVSAVIGLRAVNFALPTLQKPISVAFAGGRQSASVAVSTAGYMIKAVLVSVILLAMTMSAAVAGVLPTSVQRTISTAVSAVTPFELPEVSVYGRARANREASVAESDAELVTVSAGGDQASEQLVGQSDGAEGESGTRSDGDSVSTAINAQQRADGATTADSTIAADPSNQGHGLRQPETSVVDILPPGLERLSNSPDHAGSPTGAPGWQESVISGSGAGQGQGGGQPSQPAGQGAVGQGQGGGQPSQPAGQGAVGQGQGGGQPSQPAGQGSGSQRHRNS